MFSFLRSFLRQKGAVLVLTAVMLPFVLGVTGLAIDCGNLYLTQSRLQNAADSAVLAGATTIRDDLTSNRTTVAGIISDHGRADETADNYVDENASVPEDGRGYDAMSTGGQLQYSVSLRKEVPVYLMRIFTSGKTYTVNAKSKAAIIGTGKTKSKNLFVFKDSLDEVNSINNPDNMNIKGQISSTFDGDISYTDGIVDANYNPISNPSYKPKLLEYSSQNKNLKYFFTKQAQDENCSVQEAIDKGYGHQAGYIAYDMEALYREVKQKTQVKYTNGQNPNTNESIFDQPTSKCVYFDDVNCNLNVNKLPGSSKDPVYLYISDKSGVINVNVNSDNERPLIICYHGTGEVHFALNGHTFRGIVYAPNSPKILFNANGGYFYGSIVATGIDLRNDRGHFLYEDFDDNSSGGTTTTGSNYEVKLL